MYKRQTPAWVTESNPVSKKNKIKQSIGIVPQDLAIYEEISAEKNVSFFASLYGLRGQKLKERTAFALDLVGLTDKRKNKPKTFSGGMKRRLNIACAIAHDPQIIIMDEPTVGIDPQSRNHILESILKLKEHGVSILYSTHYMEEVVDADQVFVMDDGRIVMHGTPREIFSRVDELKKYRMDVPQVTMLADELIHRGVDLPKGILRREELVEALCRLR